MNTLTCVETYCRRMKYADDITLFEAITFTHPCPDNISSTQLWIDRSGMTLNRRKSKQLLFSCSHDPHLPVYLNIETVSEVAILVVT